MRQSLAAAAVFACAALTAGADDTGKYTSAGGKYTVRFPAGTKVKVEKQDAGAFSLNTATAKADGKTFVVMDMALPGAVKDVPAKALLDGAEKGAVEKSGGRLVKSQELAFGPTKLPGRDVLVEKDGNQVRTWIVVAQPRVYIVVVDGPKDFASGKDAAAFLDSFEITK